MSERKTFSQSVDGERVENTEVRCKKSARGYLAGVTLASAGGGGSESNTVIFHSNPLPPKLQGHFEAVLEADGHGLNSCHASRQSVFSISNTHQNPSKIP